MEFNVSTREDYLEDEEEEEEYEDVTVDDVPETPIKKMRVKFKWSYRVINDNHELKFYYLEKSFLDAIETVAKATKDANEKPCDLGKVVFVVHGYHSYSGEQWMKEIRDAFLNLTHDNHNNVILVDWSKCCRHLDYRKSVKNAKPMGRILAEFAKELVKYGTKKRNIHIIGHSLGAHVAGFAGKEFKVGRITGLDPAGPCFRKHKHNPNERLDKTDADFVDVIHSDTRRSFSKGKIMGFGLSTPIGDVDFYPNGGFWQPISAADYIRYGGSHNVSISIFIDSLTNPYAYLARNKNKLVKEHDQIQMGYGAIKYKGAQGSYIIDIGRDKMHTMQKRVYSRRARKKRNQPHPSNNQDDVAVQFCIPVWKPMLKWTNVDLS